MSDAMIIQSGKTAKEYLIEDTAKDFSKMDLYNKGIIIGYMIGVQSEKENAGETKKISLGTCR